MTTAELVKLLAQRLTISQKQSRALLDSYITAINGQLIQHNDVVIRNFGSFSIKEVAEKRAYIPGKDSFSLIPAHQKLHFKAAKRLRDGVKQVTPDEQGS